MTYGEFWDNDPKLVRYYHKANLLKMQNESDNMWLQGLYIHRAFDSVIANFSAGMAGKRGKETYFSEPIKVIPETEKEKQVRLEKERLQMQEEYIKQLKSEQQAFEMRRKKENAE